MKKLFLLALAFCSLTAFAQTNLFDASQASVLSTWGAGDVNPTATWNATAGELSIALNAVQPGWQWGNQVALGHTVDFEAGKYYQVSMTILSTADCGGVTLKFDDNNATLFENQTVNLVANTPLNYVSAASAGLAGNNHKAVFDFGYGAQGTQITISNIVIVETEAPAFDGCGETFVATSGNAAAGHDGNTGTRWESASSDPQYWQWNMAEAQTFNRIKIVWEGAYGKTFNIKAGMSCDNLTTIASVENQTLAGFPYTQIIELDESVTASSIQFEGLARGTGYGYSFWEFDVYVAEVSVVTTVELTAAGAIAKVGETVNLTPVVRDQYNAVMAGQTVTYEVTPAAAGTVVNNVFTAAQTGEVSIVAKVGEVASAPVSIFVYAGENVALNKTVTGECFNALTRVNDGNNSTELQLDPNNGGAGQDITCGFVIDMESAYDLELVTILFEGACSAAYTLEFSADNTVWSEAYAFTGADGINGHTDYIYGVNLQHKENVRYIRFTSTRNATGWGCKIFEFKAFGTDHIATAINNLETVKAVKMIENGQVVIIKNGVRYNAIGAKL